MHNCCWHWAAWLGRRHPTGSRTYFTTAAWAALKPGDAAPDFTVDAALGGKEFKFSLAEALKKGPVVLYFYPKSFTSVCTIEAHEFAENIENFAAAGASVIGLLGDKVEVQRDFSTKAHLPGHRTRTRRCMVGRLEKRFGGIDRNSAHRATDQGGHKRAAVNQVICFLTADRVLFANST